ncbi:hypothetical protein [Pseudomonas fragi]|uniref:hypothetical protein n=1 Tax=Pseudomonas fragi TaxID=296 RepID=UPI0014759491|nr:hypothetical protein [Pseudomonas fragi]
MTDNTKSREGPLKPFSASFAQAPAQRNKSDAWAKAASELTLSGVASMAVPIGAIRLMVLQVVIDRTFDGGTIQQRVVTVSSIEGRNGWIGGDFFSWLTPNSFRGLSPSRY